MIMRFVSLIVMFLSLHFISVLAQNRVEKPIEYLKQSGFETDAGKALNLIYNLDFSQSDLVLSRWRDQDPDHPMWIFWEGLKLWWLILPDLENESRDESFFETMNRLNQECEKILAKYEHHQDALVLQTLAQGFIARQLSNRDNWIRSLYYGRLAVKSLNRLKSDYPEMPDILFGDGMFNYYLDYIPKAYPMVKTISWFLPEGNRILGLKQLRSVTTDGLFLESESAYFLGNIYLNYEVKQDSALYYFELLNRKFPENPFYVDRLIHLWYKVHSLNKAVALTDSLYQTLDSEMYMYNHISADVFSRKIRALTLTGYYKEALELIKTTSNVEFVPYQQASNYYYAGRSNQLMDEIKQAVYYYQMAKEMNIKPFKQGSEDQLKRLE